MYCRHCGAYNDESSRYCENCGSALYAAPQFPQEDNNPKNRKRKIIWAVIIAAMAVILAVIAVVVWKNVAQQEQYTEQMSLGEKYLAQMNYEDAEICFREAIEINPRQAQPYLQLSTVLTETKRYEEAQEVLTRALETIPAKETARTEAIKRRLSEVEKLIEESEAEEEESKDALSIAMDVLGYPYLSDNSYVIQFIHEDNNVKMSCIEDEGILSADLYDYDQDGQDEILAVVLSRQDTQLLSQVFVLNMLEQEESGEWKLSAQLTVSGEYQALDAISCPARMEFFAKSYDDHMGIFMEATGIASHLADGSSWELFQAVYQNGTFRQEGEGIAMAGSDDIADACFRMDDTYSRQGDEASQETILRFTGNVRALGLDPDRLGWDAPLTEQDDSLRSLVRLQKSTQVTSSEAFEWINGGGAQPFGEINVVITDFTKTREAQETSAEGSYQAEIMTYQGNEDIQYPRFSPSSPTVDQWNAHFEEMASTVQSTQDDMLADGITNAWAKQEAQIMYQEGSLVSIRFLSDEFYGGAHGMTREFGETIDLNSDHTYTLEELLNTDTATAQQMVNDGFNQLIAANPDEFFGDAVSDVSPDFQEVGYYKTPEGIKVISTLYWLAPYAAGTHEILLQPVGT